MKLVLVILIVAFTQICLGSVLQPQPQCAQKGEYCLTHTDCCSKNCLTYSYKCIRNLQQYPYYYYGSAILPPRPVEKPGISLDELLFQAFPSHSYNDYKPTQAEEVGTSIITTDASNVENRLGEEAQLVEIKDNTCSRVGEKCYKHSECCTKRCHGFLHQCVT